MRPMRLRPGAKHRTCATAGPMPGCRARVLRPVEPPQNPAICVVARPGGRQPRLCPGVVATFAAKAIEARPYVAVALVLELLLQPHADLFGDAT